MLETEELPAPVPPSVLCIVPYRDLPCRGRSILALSKALSQRTTRWLGWGRRGVTAFGAHSVRVGSFPSSANINGVTVGGSTIQGGEGRQVQVSRKQSQEPGRTREGN